MPSSPYSNIVTKNPSDYPWFLASGIAQSSCMIAYQPKGATSLIASKYNLSNPGTYDAITGVSTTWDVTNGWKGGSTAYWVTINGLSSIPITWSCIVRYTTLTVDGIVFGNYVDASHGFYLSPNTSGKVYYGNGRSNSGIAPAATAGTLAIAGLSGYRNGVFDQAIIAGGSTLSTSPIYALHTAVYIQAEAWYNFTLSAEQVLALTNAMNAL